MLTYYSTKTKPIPVLNPAALKGGELLEKDIDDSQAYMWDSDATAF